LEPFPFGAVEDSNPVTSDADVCQLDEPKPERSIDADGGSRLVRPHSLA
jgi:hypothetical protein